MFDVATTEKTDLICHTSVVQSIPEIENRHQHECVIVSDATIENHPPLSDILIVCHGRTHKEIYVRPRGKY
jgi:hypothetical protein